VDLEVSVTNDKVAAKKKLERIRSVQPRSGATGIDMAELDADIIMIRRELAEIDNNGAIQRLWEVLERSNYQSLWVGRLFAGLLTKPEQAHLLEELISKSPAYGERTLPLLTRLAQLQGRFNDSVHLATQWMRSFPFDPGAPTNLTYLLCDFAGDYEAAVDVGREGLKRAPHFLPLINNLAYALASSGRLKEAKRVLVETREYPASLATKGFIALLEGDRSQGDAWYEAAAKVASESDEELEQMIRTRWLIALAQTGHLDVAEVDKHIAIRDRTIGEALASTLWRRVLSTRA
jgi:hypothetical protein